MVEQKVRLSHNLLARVTDKAGPQAGDTRMKKGPAEAGPCDGDPNDAKLEPIFRFH